MTVGTAGTVVSLLKSHTNPVLLLGAGSSKQSGIKLVSEIVEEVAKWGYCESNALSVDDPRLTMSDWRTWVKKFDWYCDNPSELYPIIIEKLLNPKQKRKEFFLNIINPNVPVSKGYLALAELISLKYFDTILTTNFDDCLTVAKSQIRKPPFLQTIKTHSDWQLFSNNPRHPQLIYVHGSVEHYSDLNLVNELKQLNQEVVDNLKPLLRDRPLIVVGYRGAESSIMRSLLLNNLQFTNTFKHGIYWCILKKEINEIKTNLKLISPMLAELQEKAGSNFQVIPIDGFDELFNNEILERLRAEKIDLSALPLVVSEQTADNLQGKPTLDRSIGSVEFALLRERIQNYCQRLNIKIFDDENWLKQQIVHLNLAEYFGENKFELTTAGILLFSSKTQSFFPNAKIIIKFRGNPDWLQKITFSSDEYIERDMFENKQYERTINGNLWTQLNEIIDVLSIVNKPYRLKGEISETVFPYPVIALKEVIINALVHRDYGINQPIQIIIEEERISFISPGGLIEEVKRQLGSVTIENFIKEGHRGIKGYRNPVVADLFYGAGAMDKVGSGLSDVFKTVKSNSSNVTFGPSDSENSFQVIIYRRKDEYVDSTETALSNDQVARFLVNMLEIIQLPDKIYFADTDIRSKRELFKSIGNVYAPPLILSDKKVISFNDFTNNNNPIEKVVDRGTFEFISTDDYFFDTIRDHQMVQLLNKYFTEHLFSLGLRVDTSRNRAYFTKSPNDAPKEIRYQARLKKATRTVTKPRISSTTGKTMFWEHKSFWFQFEKIGGTWCLIIEPSYVFTFDGLKGLLKSERVNVLSTRRASRDYNKSFHNDLVFWSYIISNGTEGPFVLHSNYRDEQQNILPFLGYPEIIMLSTFPTLNVSDSNIGEEYIDPSELVDTSDIDAELEKIVESIQKEGENRGH